MSDDFDDLRSSLKRASDDFRPALDPAVLAEAGRRGQRRRNTILSIGGVGALVVAVALVVPALMPAPSVVPAIPAPAATPATPSSTPTPTTRPVGGPYPVIQGTVSTQGWKTFASKEYPVTFKYPANWSIDYSGATKTDGCETINCVAFINPPRGTKAGALELIRNGFAKDNSTGGSLGEPADIEVLGALPNLQAWSAQADSAATQALVVRKPADTGGDDYALGTGDLDIRLALGQSSDWPQHPERVFTFATNLGNLGGSWNKAGRDTVIAILASAVPNAAFNPTRPTDNSAGDPVMKPFDPMGTPKIGQVVPDSSWKTLKVTAGNVSVRYPSNWKVTDDHDGVIWIEAPSGYIVDLLTNTSAESCDSGDMATAARLGTAGIKATARPFGSGPVELWWENGGEFPVWAGLVQHADGKACYQRNLNYGGAKDVYLGSADNGANPTKKELRETVAILASASRLH
jgi:hypothetical protein